jgi:hypothetical protein
VEGIELVCLLDWCWLGAAVAVADGVEEGEDDAHLWLCWWWWLVVGVALGAGWGGWGMTQVGCVSWRMRRLSDGAHDGWHGTWWGEVFFTEI